jgi:hypothetical protein
MSVSNPQWFVAGDNAEIGFRWIPGGFGSLVWFDFQTWGRTEPDHLHRTSSEPPGP